jgi:transcriptional regulator with GAF, ATPase, and Fis domain
MPNEPKITDQTALTKLIQAAHAMDAGEYRPEILAGLIEEQDEMGQLARVVDSVARNVAARDRQLTMLRVVIPTGVALSAEKNFNRLLETVVVESQKLTNADGGTLYLFHEDELRFVILRNTSLNIRMGGTGAAIAFNPIPLYTPDGKENHANVASHVALTRKRISIPDAYEAAGFDFSGTRAFDGRTGYRSKSFLTIPLNGEGGSLIGVLQLINAKDSETGEIVPFGSDDVLEALVLLASAALDGYIREEKLRQVIAQLRIEIDEGHRAKQVAEITDTQYFRKLQEQARAMRDKKP